MFKRFINRVFSIPTVSFRLPKVSLPIIRWRFPEIRMPSVRMPSIKLPTIGLSVKRITTILGAINAILLVAMGSLGLFISYINPIPTITPYISMGLANELYAQVVFLQANLLPTIGASSGLILLGLLLHLNNFRKLKMN